MARSKKQKARSQQKRALKRRRRQKEVRKRPKAELPQKGSTFKVSESQFSSEEYVFWLAHGANYIASDFSQGTWTPIFPEIYEGKLPASETIAHKAMAFCGIEESLEVELTPHQKAVLAWTIHDREVVYIFKLACLNRLELALKGEEVDIEARVRQPFVSEVWEVFDTITAQLEEGKNDDLEKRQASPSTLGTPVENASSDSPGESGASGRGSSDSSPPSS